MPRYNRDAMKTKTKTIMAQDNEESSPKKITDIKALEDNVAAAVMGFAERWMSMPRFTEQCEVMDQGQLRDAMGLRATIDTGDPWPTAEKMLLEHGFRWHWLGGMRVMFLQERDSFVPDTGWQDAEEVKSEE